MTHAISSPSSVDLTPAAAVPSERSDPAYQAYQILHLGFTVAPILAGADKFFHLLVNWDNYLAPVANRALGGHGHEFMLVAGVIEIVAGIGVALRSRLFTYVVAAGLLAVLRHPLLVPPS